MKIFIYFLVQKTWDDVLSTYYGLEMTELNWTKFMGGTERELRSLYTQLSALSSKPRSKMHTNRASWAWLVPGSAPVSLLCPGLCIYLTSRKPRFKQPGRLAITPVRNTLKGTGRAWKPLHEVPHHRIHCLTPVSLRNLPTALSRGALCSVCCLRDSISEAQCVHAGASAPPLWGLHFQGMPCDSWPRTVLAEPHHHGLILLVFMGHQAMP